LDLAEKQLREFMIPISLSVRKYNLPLLQGDAVKDSLCPPVAPAHAEDAGSSAYWTRYMAAEEKL